MKRLLRSLTALFALGLALTSCSENREDVLKVYNWSCYIGEGVIDDFKDWYKEQTGKDIEVVYQTFDVNETMLSKIEKGHEDFDVVCPSDYIIERMLNDGLLLPLDFSAVPDSINYIVKNRSPYITETFRKINPVIDANDYSVAFMWGTTGILYNRGKVSDEDASSWEVLRNPAYAGKIFIKDAPRDVFGPVLIHLRQEELRSGAATLDDLALDSSDKAIADVEAFMKEVKEGVAGWEADFGKEQMTQERGWISMNWSGDAMWAIDEAAEVGVDLAYVVPEEGSNVWFDGWVIPKYAQNVKAATLFIDFMCRPDIAIRNMEETGYVSANGDFSVLESQIDESLEPIDVSYFFGPDATAVRVNPAMYPGKDIISRCTLMHDWGRDTDKLISMWSRIKGDNAGSTTVIVIALAICLVIFVAVRSRMKSSSRRKGASKKKRR